MTAVFTMMITACSATPKPIDLPISLPETFSKSGQFELADQWWRDFGDEELNRLISVALEDNPTIQATWDRVTQAEAIARRETARRWPSLFFNGSASRSRDNTDKLTDRVNLGLNAAYEADFWGRVRSNAFAAQFGVDASQADLRTAAITLSAEIAKTWYQLVEQRGQLTLLERQIITNEQVLELVTLRFHQGQASAADVLRQRQLVEETRGNTKDVIATIETATHQLATLLGKSPNAVPISDRETLIPLPPLPKTGIPADLLQRRPDVQQSFYQVQAADTRIAVAIADRLPHFDITGSLTTALTSVLSPGTFATTPAGLLSSWLATMASQVALPIIDAGLRAAEVDRTQAALLESLHNYEAIVLIALREVEDALSQEAQQREKETSLETQLQLANHVIQSLRGRYIQGSSSYLDILSALISQQNLERQKLTARRDLIGFRIDLARSLAGGWTMTKPETQQLISLQD